jgi:DNA-binding CsgD family transcriptional regulator
MMPIEATYHGAEEGWHSTGLDYGDYSRMATHSHKPSGERRLPTPAWVFNHRDMREVITLAMEVRAGLVRPLDDGGKNKRVTSWRGGTEPERLARAEQRCGELAARYEKTLKELCEDYTTNPDAAAREKLAKHIEHVDGLVKSYRAGAKLLAGVVYNYYHLRLDSVGAATAIGMRPPFVRQVLFRLNKIWEVVQEIRTGERKLMPWKPRAATRRQQAAQRAVALHGAGMTWEEAAKKLGYSSFGGLRKLLIEQGLYEPNPKHPGWDGKRIIDYAAVMRLRAQGVTYKAIAEQLGFTEVAVWQAIRRGKQGTPACERTSYRTIDPEKVLQLRAQGLTHKEISKQLGCSIAGSNAVVWRMRKRASQGREMLDARASR